MATGETNFAVGDRKTYKRDRTPPAAGEQVLILRTDGDKAKVVKSDKTLPFAKCAAQVKGSGLDGAPDKWVWPVFWLDCDGNRPGIDAGDGIVTLAQALGERDIPVRTMTSTHPNPKRQANGPVKHLAVEDVVAWLRTKDKREVKAVLAHKPKKDVKPKSLEDYEAYVDYYIVDTSFAPSSPDDTPMEDEGPDPEGNLPGGPGEAAAEVDEAPEPTPEPETVKPPPAKKAPPAKSGKKK
jgi:hypothetical protein